MAEFRVAFRGRAVEAHTIDAETLGASLMAIAELIQVSSSLLEDTPKARYRVNVTATEPGSFEVALELVEWWDRVAALVVDDDRWSAAAILLTIFGSGGLLGALAWLHGRKPDQVTESADRSIVRVDDDEREFRAGVGRLSMNFSVRRHIRHLVRPVDGEGIDEIAFTYEDHTERIDTDAARSLEAPLEEQLITDETSERVLIIETVHMNSRTWAFRDAVTREYLYAEIDDDTFKDSFDAGQEPIRKGDTLRVRLRLQQWEEDIGPRTRHTIVRVLDHNADAGLQMPLEIITPIGPPRVADVELPPSEEE